MNVLVLTTDLGTLSGWSRYSADVVQALSKHGVVAVVVSEQGQPGTHAVLPRYRGHRTGYLSAPFHALKLRNLARNCTAIHALVEPYAPIAYWLSVFTGIPYFVTAHGSHAVQPFVDRWFKRILHAHALASARAVLCVSSYTRRRLEAHGITNCVVTPNGINVEKFYHPPVPTNAARENRIVTVGALKRRKGQHVSLAAFAQCTRRIPDARYTFVGDQGDAAYVDQLKRSIADAGLMDRVEFRENISDEELVALYRCSKICVLTSLSTKRHFEGFGLVYLEANLCGVPAIGSLDSGAEDAIVDEKTGFLVPQEDVDAIAAKMEQLLVDDVLWNRMSESGVVWGRNHGWTTMIAEYARLYGLT